MDNTAKAGSPDRGLIIVNEAFKVEYFVRLKAQDDLFRAVMRKGIDLNTTLEKSGKHYLIASQIIRLLST